MKKIFLNSLFTSTLTIVGAQASAQNWSENYLIRSKVISDKQQSNSEIILPITAKMASKTIFEGRYELTEKKEIKHSKFGFEVGMVNYRQIGIDRTQGPYQSIKFRSERFPYIGIFYNINPKLQLTASLETIFMYSGITAKVNSGIGSENSYGTYRTMSYLKIPVRVHYTFFTSNNNRWKFAVGTGITGLFRGYNSYTFRDISMGENVKGVNQTLEPSFQTAKHGIAIPLSLQVKFANKYGNDMFVLDVTYHQGLTPIYKANLTTTFDNEPGRVVNNTIINRGSFLDVKLGYRFQFRKFN